MAHAQHTPAPWRLNAGNETLVMGSNQRPIARAECGGTAGIRLAEAEANARLIAAAPDLLAALDAIVAKAHEYGGRSDTPDNVACGFYDIIEDARAAIAKATGQPAP